MLFCVLIIYLNKARGGKGEEHGKYFLGEYCILLAGAKAPRQGRFAGRNCGMTSVCPGAGGGGGRSEEGSSR